MENTLNVRCVKNIKKESVSVEFTVGDDLLYCFTTKHFDLQALINTLTLVLGQHRDQYNITNVALINAIE